MFDLNKLGDMSKIAGQAKQMQKEQERVQREQSRMIKEISDKLDSVLAILRQNSK